MDNKNLFYAQIAELQLDFNSTATMLENFLDKMKNIKSIGDLLFSTLDKGGFCSSYNCDIE